jgi:hypothetical protein
MKSVVKNLLIKVVPVLDILFSPLTFIGACLMLLIRKAGIHRMPVSKRLFTLVGVYPIRDHYYEPLFNPEHLQRPMQAPRHLPGLDMNEAGQLALLEKFVYADELRNFPAHRPANSPLAFYYENPAFTYGDAEYLYSIIRSLKPAKIIEVGSGYSTLMAIEATKANRQENSGYQCKHVCIEPYEMPWLESSGVEVLRTKVEDISVEYFQQLQPNDILFIDSSHMIRPQGDVLYEFLELLPTLPSGVIVHIHDIFTPFDYPEDWVKGHVRLWNEQYLLEAFLSFNKEFRVIGALSWLKHFHQTAIERALPGLRVNTDAIPGSFWIVRN